MPSGSGGSFSGRLRRCGLGGTTQASGLARPVCFPPLRVERPLSDSPIHRSVLRGGPAWPEEKENLTTTRPIPDSGTQGGWVGLGRSGPQPFVPTQSPKARPGQSAHNSYKKMRATSRRLPNLLDQTKFRIPALFVSQSLRKVPGSLRPPCGSTPGASQPCCGKVAFRENARLLQASRAGLDLVDGS